MGAKQSRRSVDITTTPKKEGIPTDGGVVLGDAAAPGDGKLERIEETDTKPTTNGIAPHTDTIEDKDKDKDDVTEKEKDEVKAEETKQESAGESAAETAEVTTPTETTPTSPNAATSPETKETKKKDKMKKKWSFRSISFSKKDKSKPARDEAPKNGDVTKEEPLAEGGEEAETGSATAGSPVEEKSVVSSPSAENEAVPVSAEAAAATPASTPTPTPTPTPTTETKEDGPTSDATSPADEKQEEPTPSAPTPVPLEEKKEEVEKVEAEKKVVEVSPAGGQFVPDPVEGSVFQIQTVATPSIIERKTSEDIPSLPPSSPPPTPIDPSPLQQAQQAAATATALAEALKLPAEAAAADKDFVAQPPLAAALSYPCSERNDIPSTPPAESLDVFPQRPPGSSTDKPQTESTPSILPKLQALPVVDTTDTTCPNVTVNANTESLDATKDTGKSELENLPATETDANRLDSPSKQLNYSRDNEDVAETADAVSKTVDFEKPREIEADENIKHVPEPVISKEMETVQRQEESVCVVSMVQEPTTELQTEAPAECRNRVEAEVVEPTQVVMEETKPVDEIAREPLVPVSDSFIDSEEGPLPLSEEEIVVEAKPAVVIPEDEEIIEEEVTGTDATVRNVESESESVEAINFETKTESDDTITTPIKVMIVFDDPEDSPSPPSVPMTDDSAQPINVSLVTIENTAEKVTEVIEIAEDEESIPPPPPVSESCRANSPEKLDSENANVENDPNVHSPLIDVDDVPVNRTQELDRSSQCTECLVTDVPPVPPTDTTSSQILSDEDERLAVRSEPRSSPSRLECVSVSSDDLVPPAPRHTTQYVNSHEHPLPPEECPCPLVTSNNVSEMNDYPVPDENAPRTRNSTDVLPTPPRSPVSQSNDSIMSSLTTSTKDSSRTQFFDDQSNRDFKMESVSISLDSYNESDIELKERLAESLAETVHQEESSVSCQLSNNTTSSTTVQETHQTTPEPEAPVENNLVHDSTTESSEETTKITPPAVLTEVPASPPTVPSAPAITEDVSSVAKAIEEIDISDKAVAAATIECNTNAIIADAHYQNNINE
ncbi:cell surface glycoprotein 1-like isoform X2 [Colletes gigas]|uniref:cell surface glycoprotein 1-like isoform X2 n=1 Tax=Colletes gigas TaxID=935657 RepID=UPI001C9B3CC0|nr:cell surface glycoprotein 1-like isoform X2 [Colletes gigas]